MMHSDQAELLVRYPTIRTSDPDRLRAFFGPVYGVERLKLPDGGPADTAINHRELTDIALSYVRYGMSIQAQISQQDFFVQGFPLSGTGNTVWNGNQIPVDIHNMGTVSWPGAVGRLHYDRDFRHLVLRIAPSALTRKLAALLGRPVDKPPAMFSDGSCNPVYAQSQLRLVAFLARELDYPERLPPVVLKEIEQAVIVNFLMAHENSYSRWLRTETRPAAPWQARRAAEYIEANWNQPISIVQLSAITNTSARSLFEMFRRVYGVTPMGFVRQIRLQRARDMLSRRGEGDSVTTVCFLCGFSNLGRFARDYAAAFGERPSDTLRGP